MVKQVVDAEGLAVRVGVQKAAGHERLDADANLALPLGRLFDV